LCAERAAELNQGAVERPGEAGDLIPPVRGEEHQSFGHCSAFGSKCQRGDRPQDTARDSNPESRGYSKPCCERGKNDQAQAAQHSIDLGEWARDLQSSASTDRVREDAKMNSVNPTVLEA
jgi:hypothetical protein